MSGVYQFDGSGYAQLPQVRFHPERLSITFKFKTFWEEALLFLTVNEVTVSIQWLYSVITLHDLFYNSLTLKMAHR